MVILLLLQGCNVRKSNPDLPPPKIEKDSIFTTKTVTVTLKDTVLVSVPDSLYYEAYIECVNNKPVLRDPEEKKTTGVKSDINLKDGKLKVLVNTEAQKLFLKWKEQYVQETKERNKTISVPYPVIEKVTVPAELTFFQKLYLWIGKIVVFGLIGFILYKIPWRSFLS
ncbi:hypothetical protein [Chryseobacterium sp. G0240]|uniref:hypothetical protein n=1 Tax=Chryseobacterium sp. G0240 TaxID=2487066 RepID=UPI00161956C3|nr:hypothetical protein [Chryseobacterium sp. G0240]